MKDEFYRVIKHKSSTFEVERDGIIITAKARGKLKRDGEILVGDFALIEEKEGEKIISAIKKRENSLIRPAVANVDVIVLVVAPKPEIDWFLIDKMIINCKKAGIECLLCLNKTDIAKEEIDALKRQYGNEVSAIVSTSAIEGKVGELISQIKGKLVCFAGQSAVGKSTLSNAILGENKMETGDVSEKIGRGKNTTTTATILRSPDGFYFIDTPGFSMLDATEEDYATLGAYYDDFVRFADGCKFHPCTHTSEPDCAVKRAVERGEIDEQRYERYLKIFEESKENYKKRRQK